MSTGTSTRARSRRTLPIWIILAVLVVAETVAAFESAMVYVAFPRFMADFQTDAATVAWVATAYLLVAAAAGSLGGRFGDMYGRRRILVIVLALSAIGSVVSLLSPALPGVIAGRAIQGAAGAILPLCIAIARELLGEKKGPIGVAVVSASALIAGAGGGLVAGLLIDFGTWRNLFLMAAILAVVAVVLIIAVLPPTARLTDPPRVDILGAILLVVAVAAVLGGITFSRSLGFVHVGSLGLVILGVVVAAVLVLWESRIPYPLIQVRLFKKRRFALTLLATAALFIGAQGGSQVLLPIIFQTPEEFPVGLGQSATVAGAVTFVTSGLAFVASPFIGRLMIAVGTRKVLIVGSAATAVIALGFIWADQNLIAFIIVGGVLFGLAQAVVFTALPNSAVESVPAANYGEASGIYTTVRLIFLATGNTVAATILSSSTVEGTTVGTAAAFHTAYIVMAATALVGLVLIFLLPRDRHTAEPHEDAEVVRQPS